MESKIKNLKVDYIIIDGIKKDNLDKKDIENPKKISMDIILKEESNEI